MDLKIIIGIVLLTLLVSYYGKGAWTGLVSVTLGVLNFFYIIFILLDNNSAAIEIVLPGLIGIALYLWILKLDKDKMDKK
tara:strand:+ start:29 stop:268 length:240 start_codon:yes stop_codon:yes gene_type:complete